MAALPAIKLPKPEASKITMPEPGEPPIVSVDGELVWVESVHSTSCSAAMRGDWWDDEWVPVECLRMEEA